MRFANPSKKTRTIASTKGHAVEFPGKGSIAKKDATAGMLVTDDGLVFVHVPHLMQTEVLQHGLLSETEIEDEPESDVKVKPENPTKLKDDLYRAFDKLVADAARDDFAGTGLPKPAAVSREVGYAVSPTEVKDFWQRYTIDGGSHRD